MQIGNVSSNDFSISTSQPSRTEGKPPSHEEAVSQLGASLSEEQQGEIMSGIETMQADGASEEKIKAYVDSSLEDYGVDLSQTKGALADTTV
ncbi:hypothetical protein [Maridesulfovibrio frigidus]|uniref:hypothetical protein n=1 Tax=Maridesulfovibrio frigidus TaxID=340956 RepID=UPI0004E1FDFF|nr:hypothetical protein [Maridesulfovibrio frigidus]